MFNNSKTYEEDDDDEDNEDVRLAAADFISHQVRKALWYPEITAARDDFQELDVSQPPRLEDLVSTQAADCIGFTLVTSGYLVRSEIDHWIGFANGHATIVLDSNHREKLPMLDPLSPQLDQNIAPALTKSTKTEIRRDTRRYGRAAVLLDANKMITSTRIAVDDPFAAHPWLRWQQTSDLSDFGMSAPQDERPSRNWIVMSLFPPEIGQLVLEGYSELQHAVLDDKPKDAAQALHKLGAFYPDMDARKPHKDLNWVVRKMALHGYSNEARLMIDNYFETFTFIRDSRFAEAKGDSLGVLARASRSLPAARAAIEAYEQALQYPRAYKAAVNGKIQKLALRAGVR